MITLQGRFNKFLDKWITIFQSIIRIGIYIYININVMYDYIKLYKWILV